MRHVGTIGMSMAALAVLALAAPASADPLPTRVGQCTRTTIKSIGTRLENGMTHRPIPGSGSAVNFSNGGYQVSYDTIPAINRSRPGDPVTMCLVSVPKGCPAGDNRGLTYKTTNQRTRASWTLPDSEHMCGGA